MKYLSQPTIKTLADVKTDLILLRDEIKKVGKFSLAKPHPRLLELQRVMLFDGSLTDWVNAVLNYHEKVMEQRGGNMWVGLDEKGSFKHYFCASLDTGINTVAKYLKANIWLHKYYLETVYSIHSGLN